MAIHDNDYLHRHDDEKNTVTLKATRAGSTVEDTITYAAKLSRQSARQLFGPVALDSESTTWVIANEELTDVQDIRPGDRVTDANDITWHVEQVTRDAVETQWILLCRKGR